VPRVDLRPAKRPGLEPPLLAEEHDPARPTQQLLRIRRETAVADRSLEPAATLRAVAHRRILQGTETPIRSRYGGGFAAKNTVPPGSLCLCGEPVFITLLSGNLDLGAGVCHDIHPVDLGVDLALPLAADC
jgi:hypothetical protein